MHSRRALAHCAQMGRSSLHLSYRMPCQPHSPVAVLFAVCPSIAYLPLAAGQAVSERKVSRFLVFDSTFDDHIPSCPRSRRHGSLTHSKLSIQYASSDLLAWSEDWTEVSSTTL